jgi:hypothetical protein
MSVQVRALLAWFFLLLFVLVLFIAEGVRHHSFLLAWDILAGSVSLASVHPGLLGWALAVFGYLLLPLSIGIVGAALYARRVAALVKADADNRADAVIDQKLKEHGIRL